MTDALIYCRISQDREGAGLGVARQREDCEALAERLGWTVVGVYDDNDVSAYSGKPRPGYEALLDALRAGVATGVLAWHTDRLHRSPAELERYVQIAEEHGVTTQTVSSGQLDLATPSGRMIARQLGAVARYEVEQMSARQQRKRLEIAKAGEFLGGPRPFGFEEDGVTVRPEEAAAILNGTKAVLAGTSIRQVARDWNDAGLLTPAGNEWQSTEVRRTLLRPRNAGRSVYRGEEVADAVWPALVPLDTFRALEAMLNDPSRSRTTGPRRYLGSGLFLCGICGDTVVTQSETDRSERQYVCRSKEIVRNAEATEALVIETVLARLSQPDAEGLFTPSSEDVDLDGLHERQTLLRSRLDELAAVFASGGIDGQQLAKASDDLRAELDRVEAQIGDAVRGSPLEPFRGADPYEVWEQLDQDRQRAVIDALMEVHIDPSPKGRPKGWEPGDPYFHPESVRIEWKGEQ